MSITLTSEKRERLERWFIISQQVPTLLTAGILQAGVFSAECTIAEASTPVIVRNSQGKRRKRRLQGVIYVN